MLLITAFWQINPFTTNIERVWSLSNFTTIFTSAAYRASSCGPSGWRRRSRSPTPSSRSRSPTSWRGSPSPRTRTALFVAILLPLWASYLAKVYSWLLIFTHDGLLDWSLGKLGLGQVAPDLHQLGRVHRVLLPLAAVHDHPGLRGARADPGVADRGVAGPGRRGPGGPRARSCCRSRCPASWPGSIFTFSLTLGDYITPLLVGGTSANFIGNIIYSNIGIANNVPFAAAMALVPIVIMAIYLLGARALGAFEAV